MKTHRIRPNFTFDEDRLKELKRIAPEAFADGKVNWDTLREALGEQLEEDDAEHFGLFWPGKREARRMAATPSTGTLVPVSGEGVDEDTTRNVFIEGENLEVLKLLQKSYAGRIKMIYIDPPYNTGNDFVYEDDFAEPLQEYLRRTGQLDDEGRKLSTNTRADGRFHSKWLSMMYPRLRLARNLLCDDGVIFVSIDDNEVHHLRTLMNEVFGEENFVASFIWKRRQNVDSRSKNGASVDHEYIICFGKSEVGIIRGASKDLTKYSNPDNDPKGDWMSADMTGLATAEQRPNLHYDLVNPATGITYKCPTTGWRYEPKRMSNLIENDEVIFPSSTDGRPRRKKFLKDLESDYTGFSTILDTVYNTQATRELRALFDDKEYFDFPKPKDLIKLLIQQGAPTNESIILDFFSGSGTTAQAVLEQTKEDGINRRFIMVQLPEKYSEQSDAMSAGYMKISDVSIERIKRAANQLHGSHNVDTGIKVYRLKASNFKDWANYEGKDVAVLEEKLELFNDPLTEGWKPESLLSEVMLIERYPLDSRIELLPAYKKNTVQRVSCDFYAHALVVCLDSKLHPDTVADLELADGDIFICLDSAITDNAKVRLSDKGILKTI